MHSRVAAIQGAVHRDEPASVEGERLTSDRERLRNQRTKLAIHRLHDKLNGQPVHQWRFACWTRRGCSRRTGGASGAPSRKLSSAEFRLRDSIASAPRLVISPPRFKRALPEPYQRGAGTCAVTARDGRGGSIRQRWFRSRRHAAHRPEPSPPSAARPSQVARNQR